MIFEELERLFTEAKKDPGTRSLHGSGYKAYMFYGIKIAKDDLTQEIEIFDPCKGGNYYVEISPENYDLFFKYGWRKAVFIITLDKLKTKVKKLNELIRAERNKKNINEKAITNHRITTDNALKKFNDLTLKLNEL